MAIAPPPPAWVEWASLVGVGAAVVMLFRIGVFVGDIRHKVNTMWESWVFEHAHITPPARGRASAPKQGNPRS